MTEETSSAQARSPYFSCNISCKTQATASTECNTWTAVVAMFRLPGASEKVSLLRPEIKGQDKSKVGVYITPILVWFMILITSYNIL